MRMGISLFVVVAVANLGVQAADPTITGAKSTEYLAELKVENVSPGTAVIWDLFHQETGRRLGKKKVIPISRECVFAGPKGKYDVLVRLVKGEDVKELTYEVEITGGVAPPPVPPGPQPPPTPDPVRKDMSYQLIFVEETSEAAAGRGALFTSKTLDARMKAKGHSWRIVDKDNTGPDVQDEIKASAGKGYPQIFLVDKAKKLPTIQVNAPTKWDEVIKLLEQYGG